MDDTYSLVIDLATARTVFLEVGLDAIALAVLAGITPEAAWHGCLLYEGPSPLDEGETACLATRGPGADRLQERLVEALEHLGIPVLAVYEGGPDVRRALARADTGRWVSAT